MRNPLELTVLLTLLIAPVFEAAAVEVVAPVPTPVRDTLSATERQLLSTFEALASGDGPKALELADSLAGRVGDFALLNALREELRGARTASDLAALKQRWLASQAGAGPGPSAPGSLLVEEARQRWRHRDYAVPSTLPFVLALDRAFRHLIVVETSTSRLFLFRHDAKGLQLERDFYTSIGRRGSGKEQEGDERTPLGVYFTLSRMDEEGLAERYGAHAFPLDYPNAWDRRAQRTGRGIWIHGVPPETYSRPPLDSDGCVAMTNVDIQWMAKRLSPRRTPVVIVEQVPWAALTPPLGSEGVAAVLRQRIQHWLRTWRAPGGEASSTLAGLYEVGVVPPGPTAALALEQVGAVERLALLQDPTNPGVVVASFGDGLGGWYRQHWRRDDAGEWRITAERLRPPRR